MATRKQLEQALQNPNVRKFLDLISYTEGTQGNGYRTAFGGGKLNSLNDQPLANLVKVFAKSHLRLIVYRLLTHLP